MSVFKEGNRLCWQVPTLKKTFSSVVTMKHKLEKGIILSWSWEGYAVNYVSYFLLCVFYYFTMLFHPNDYLNQDHLWIHHWVILQFVNPLFQSLPTMIYVGWGLMVSGSFSSNITTGCSSSVAWMDDELQLEHQDCFNEIPRFGLVWLGQRVDE